MNLNLHHESHAAPPAARFYYLDSQTRKGVDEVLQRTVSGRASTASWSELCRLLPVERQRHESVRRRVEGMTYAADWLWDEALRIGKKEFGPNFDRANLRRSIRSYPISHYHYLMGSREPRDVLLTRRDGLHDPRIALAKLQHDVEELFDFVCRFSETHCGLGTNPTPADPA